MPPEPSKQSPPEQTSDPQKQLPGASQPGGAKPGGAGRWRQAAVAAASKPPLAHVSMRVAGLQTTTLTLSTAG